MFLTSGIGIMLPFIGTALGSAAVFMIKKNRKVELTGCLAGFSAGVMMAASVWSLLLPALESSAGMGIGSFLPSCIGFLGGIGFMIISEKLIDRFVDNNKLPGVRGSLVTAFAVTLHNIPEGMAVGMVYAALISEINVGTAVGALSLSLGIAIQNIPEGAIVSLPLFSERMGRLKAFLCGVISGAVEPLSAIVAILCVSLFTPLMSYFLSFAAGTMVFVVMKELSEEMKGDGNRGIIFFALGFTVMMSLDVALG